MSITAIVENDTIKLPVHVPDGTRVEIVLPGEDARATAKSPAFASLLKHAGTVSTLPADFADRHDDYIRGRIAR